MKIVSNHYPKVCHAKPGDIIQLLEDDGEPGKGLYMVCIYWREGQKKSRKPLNGLNGLYNIEQPLFLVNIETGEAKNMIHLSERASIINDAELVVPGVTLES